MSLPLLREGGYKLHRFELQKESLGATLESVRAPALLRRTLSLSPNPRNGALRCPMFVKIMRRGQAYKLGVRPGDMLVDLSEDRLTWQMGSIESLEHKLLSSNSFEMFVLRRDHDYVRPCVVPSDAVGTSPRKRDADCESNPHRPAKLFVSTKDRDRPSLHTPNRETSKTMSKGNDISRTPELKDACDDSSPLMEGESPNRIEKNVQPEENENKLQLDASEPCLEDLVRSTISPMDARYFVQLLDDPLHLESFLEKDGLETVFRLLETSTVEKVHTFCWELIDTCQRCFDCGEKLSDVSKLLVSSLGRCESEKLFQVILCIMLSPAMDSLASLHEFALMDGVIPSFLKAMEQSRQCEDSAIESIRLLNQMILHPDAMQILKDVNGLSSIARIMDEYKASASLQQVAREVLLNLLA